MAHEAPAPNIRSASTKISNLTHMVATYCIRLPKARASPAMANAGRVPYRYITHTTKLYCVRHGESTVRNTHGEKMTNEPIYERLKAYIAISETWKYDAVIVETEKGICHCEYC